MTGRRAALLWPVVLGLGLLASSPHLPAQGAVADDLQDWPQWLGPQRDGVWRETGILTRLPTRPLEVKWRATLAAGYAGPSVAGGRVFVTDFVKQSGRVTNRPSTEERVAGQERVCCFDADTGKPIWTHAYTVDYAVSYPGGPRASPLVHGDRVFTLGTDGDLLCLDTATGKVIWSRRFMVDYGARTPFWGHSAHPLLDGTRLICMVGGKGSTVVAFDRDTGAEVWKALDAREPGYAPPSLAVIAGVRTLLVWHPESLNALDPVDGAVRWSIALPARSGMSVTAPLAVGNGIYVSGIGTPPALIRAAAPGREAGAAARSSAEILWRGGARQGITAGNSSPLVHEGILYGVDTQGRLIASSFDTGEQLWSTFNATTGAQRVSYATAFLVRHGERFFIFNEQGELILAELSEDGYTELGRSRILTPTTTTYGRKVIWSHPAFARRCVFARNDEAIVCVALAAKSQ